MAFSIQLSFFHVSVAKVLWGRLYNAGVVGNLSPVHRATGGDPRGVAVEMVSG